ncbi:acid phosphatase [Zalerion maritima]|uniref:Acid phosphatase n=1 Tax=Zalerion maritima TaxID=339359 RepID=A0AAD5RK55_9PEZI|nr:acid phosphatase [Zalerion maritima]
MTTHLPRLPYSKEELQELYPPSLELAQVQVFLRHGERTPVSQRLLNTGLPGFWPFCSGLGNMSSRLLLPSYHSGNPRHLQHEEATVLEAQKLFWREKLETWSFSSDSPAQAHPAIRQGLSTPGGGSGGIGGGLSRSICEQGMLTDRGRETTTALGQRLRQLYVRDLGFLPPVLTPEFAQEEVYFRSTAVPRAMESLMQTVGGLWPSGRWDSGNMHARPASSYSSPSEPDPETHLGKTKLGWNQAPEASHDITPRTAFGSFPLDIVTRQTPDEDLYPNDWNCRRLAHLSRAFASRAAESWNDSPEMQYLSEKMGKWMPEGVVKVDGKPRLTGLMDTINATKAHDRKYLEKLHSARQKAKIESGKKGKGEDADLWKKPGWDVYPVGRTQIYDSVDSSGTPLVKLPSEFYDEKSMLHIMKMTVDEWYSGFNDSQEYRTLGIGSIMGDVVERMVRLAEFNTYPSFSAMTRRGQEKMKRQDPGQQESLRFALHGCHDTTLAAILASLGTLDMKTWPPFTAHIAIELFRDPATEYSSKASKPDGGEPNSSDPSTSNSGTHHEGTLEKIEHFLHLDKHSSSPSPFPTPLISRRKMPSLTTEEKSRMKGYYVRVRYNDEPMKIPGCKPEGKHWKNDEGLCTLEAFKSIVDKFTPEDWKKACLLNKGAPEFPEKPQPGGY